jgi:hypothetical protein
MFKMNLFSRLPVSIFALIPLVSGMTRPISEDEGEMKFNYEATNANSEFQGPAIVKITATSSQNPVLNKPFTIRLECTPLINAPNSTMRLLLIPEWVEIIRGDTIWTGDLEKDQKGILEVVIKPTKKKHFSVFARVDFYQNSNKLLGYTSLSFYSIAIVEEKIEALKRVIKDLKKALEEVEKGNIDYAKEIYSEVIVPDRESEGEPIPIIPISERIVERPDLGKGINKESEAPPTEEQKNIVRLEKLREEYMRLIDTLSKKVSGISKSLQHQDKRD